MSFRHDILTVFPFQDFELVKSYVSKIQELEGEVLRLQSFNSSKQNRYADLVESDDERPHSSNILFPCSNEYSSDYDPKAVDISGEYENFYGLCGNFFVLSTILFLFTL